jgi:hypothetical protein
MNIHNSIREIDQVQWKELVNNSTTASFFQTPECYLFFDSLSFLKAFVYGVSENGKLMGIICGYIIANGNFLKRFFSRRAIVPGGILLSPNISDKAICLLLENTKKELSKEAIYIEIRNYNDYNSFRSVISSTGFKYQPHLNFHVYTPNIETVTSKLSSSKRRQIKLSIKSGTEIVKAETSKDVHDYYALLKELYKIKVKLPLFPEEFFEKLILLSNADILLIKLHDKIVGGITCVYLDNRCVSEWFVCGEDGNVEKNVYPSVLATWAGIEHAAMFGFQKFDFMGAGNPNGDYGVREFKAKFGGDMVEFGRFLYVCEPFLYNLGKYIVKKLKKK